MFFSGFFLFLFIRRKNQFPWLFLSGDVELPSVSPIPPPISIPSNNLTELLLEKRNITIFQPNRTDGMDNRIPWDFYNIENGHLRSVDTSPSRTQLHKIRRNLSKHAMISFLENPNISIHKKQEILKEPDSKDLFDDDNNTRNVSVVRGFRMEAGGLWKDWNDSIYLFL
jgi:hypothetical protein